MVDHQKKRRNIDDLDSLKDFMDFFLKSEFLTFCRADWEGLWGLLDDMPVDYVGEHLW